MTSEEFQSVEGQLYKYMRATVVMERIESEIAELEQQIKELDLTMRHLYSLGEPSISPNMSGMPPSQSYEQSPIGRKIDAQFGRWEESMGRKVDKRLDLRLQLMDLQEQHAGMEFAVGRLSPEFRELAEQRYLYERSNLQIAVQLKCDETTVRRRREQLVEAVGRILGVVSTPEGAGRRERAEFPPKRRRISAEKTPNQGRKSLLGCG